MPVNIVELYGFEPLSEEAGDALRKRLCPFIGERCRKVFNDGMPNGACTACADKNSSPIIFCPIRLYAEDYKILRNVAGAAFEGSPYFLRPGDTPPPTAKTFVLPFGQRIGGEIRLKMRNANFAVDWILAHVTPTGELLSFVPVEIQTVDTTGNYRLKSWLLHEHHGSPDISKYPRPQPASSGFNFENVNKRILPQIISKSHALRREAKCSKGMFFICPTPVYKRIFQRLGGGEPATYPMHAGSITFQHYDIDTTSHVRPYPLSLVHSVTTTTEQVALAFSSAVDLPVPGVYESAIEAAVKKRLGASNLPGF